MRSMSCSEEKVVNERHRKESELQMELSIYRAPTGM